MREWTIVLTTVLLLMPVPSFGESEVDQNIDRATFSLENRELREWLLSEQIQAWEMCYRDLLSIDEISDEERDLTHYDTEFYRDRDHWVIRFRRKPTHDASGAPRIQGIVYWVGKLSMRIAQRVYED